MARYLPEARGVNALGALREGQQLRAGALQMQAQEQKADKENFLQGLRQGVAGGNQNALRQLSIEAPGEAKNFLALQQLEQKEARDTEVRNTKFMGQMAATIHGSAPEDKAQTYQMVLGELEKKGMDTSQYPPEYNDETAQEIDAGLVMLMNQARDVGDIVKETEIRRVAETKLKTQGTKPLAAEKAKALTLSKGGLKSIQELNDVLKKFDGVVPKFDAAMPEMLKSPDARKIALLSKDLADSIGRLRSGGAINEEELATFKSFIPNAFDDTETVKFKLQKLEEKFRILQTGITGEEPERLVLGKQDSEPTKDELMKRYGLR